MPTDPVLTLAQWFSPAFPVGAFAYSHGLETVIADETLTSAPDLKEWCDALLTHGSLRNDLIFLAAAYQNDPKPVHDLALAFCGAEERRIETLEQGQAFARTLRDIHRLDLPDYVYPVAVGRAAALCDLPLALTAQFYAQAFIANLISTAVRRVPLGQTEGQRVLTDLQPMIEAQTAEVITLGLDDLASSCLVAEIAAMRHETLAPRVFRT